MNEQHESRSTFWHRAQSWVRSLLPQNESPEQNPEEIENPCCNQPFVHVAFRGKADDRLYLTQNRKWQEVRFFQPNGLRVFCAACRRRLL